MAAIAVLKASLRYAHRSSYVPIRRTYMNLSRNIRRGHLEGREGRLRQRLVRFYSKERDLYEVLGVSKNASPKEIRQAYLRLSKRLHPDVSGRDTREEFTKISKAYNILSDDFRRIDYDQMLQQGISSDDQEYIMDQNWEQGMGLEQYPTVNLKESCIIFLPSGDRLEVPRFFAIALLHLNLPEFSESGRHKTRDRPLIFPILVVALVLLVVKQARETVNTWRWLGPEFPEIFRGSQESFEERKSSEISMSDDFISKEEFSDMYKRQRYQGGLIGVTSTLAWQTYQISMKRMQVWPTLTSLARIGMPQWGAALILPIFTSRILPTPDSPMWDLLHANNTIICRDIGMLYGVALTVSIHGFTNIHKVPIIFGGALVGRFMGFLSSKFIAGRYFSQAPKRSKPSNSNPGSEVSGLDSTGSKGLGSEGSENLSSKTKGQPRGENGRSEDSNSSWEQKMKKKSESLRQQEEDD
ncbi:hypothetical protein AAMO2058_001463600 [Amorphochlora amoebiformis]